MLSPKSRARIGLCHLEEAILVVLLHEPNLRQGEISNRLGIPPTDVGNYYGIVGGILGLLRKEKRVQSDGDPNKPRWDLTEAERNLMTALKG